MQKHIFKKYDIRGIVGKDLQIDQVYNLTHAIIDFYLEQNHDIKCIAVARDHRIYSEEIYQHVVQAIIDRGLQVYFLGVCPTPVFVFGLYRLPVQAGIMITGSHHTSEYNGFKLYLDKKSVWGTDIDIIYQKYKNGCVIKAEQKGTIYPCPIIDQYVASLWQEFSHLSQYDFSIVVDCAGGVVGPVLEKIIMQMKWKRVKIILSKPDPLFVVHEPDPVNSKNMIHLHKELVNSENSAFGIGFDGDAGRMICLEHDGTLILGDRLLALFAQDVLKKNKHAAIVYDVKSSMLVQEIIEQCEGKAIVSASGCPLVKSQMEKSQALLGGEVSGHYFFKDRHYGYDDGIYAMLRLLDILVKERKSIYELLRNLPERYSSYEIRIPCNDEQKNEIIDKIRQAVSLQSQWKISQIDGIRAENNHGWGLLRASQTQSVVSFRCEAKNKKDLHVVKEEFKNFLSPYIQADVLKEYF